MSTDIGNKRSIDDIQDANDTEPEQVPPQNTDNENGMTDTNYKDIGVSTTTTTAAAAPTADVPTTTETNTQRSDLSKAQERQRGQRMFGMLMGTLNKFDKTEKKNEEQARKRQAIDTKHQERLLEERKAIQASLLQSQQERAKQNQQRQADRDEKRMKWSELQRQKLAHYLVTTTSPQLSYLPKILLPQQQEQIDQQIRDLESTVTPVATEDDPNQQD